MGQCLPRSRKARTEHMLRASARQETDPSARFAVWPSLVGLPLATSPRPSSHTTLRPRPATTP
jgi:hypothetical protein